MKTKKKRKLRRPKKVHYERIPKKWSTWLEAIQNDTMHLLHLHNIHSEVIETYRKNKQLRQHNDTVFIDYFNETYASRIAVGIRCITDVHRRSLSLIKLMWEICDNCNLLTRRRYVHMYKPSARLVGRAANKHFDKLAGKGKSSLTKSIVRKDISSLKNDERIKRIRNHVNKSLAHRNIKPITKLPTYHDLRRALGLVEYVVTRYSSLLFAQGWIKMTPTIQCNWTAIFEYPWIPTRRGRTIPAQSKRETP